LESKLKIKASAALGPNYTFGSQKNSKVSFHQSSKPQSKACFRLVADSSQARFFDQKIRELIGFKQVSDKLD